MIDPKKLRDFVEHHSIKREMALYAESCRPIHAWRAYHWIRQSGLPVPPWFLEYLDGCAERLTKTNPAAAEEIAEAFDMGAAGRNSTECRRLKAVEMTYARKRPGVRLDDIFGKVARELGVSKNYVKNAYYDWYPRK